MTSTDLPDLREADPARLAAANRQLRSAALWPARVVASYAGDAPDAKLAWCPQRNAITTCVFDDGLQLELRPSDLSMQFLEHSKPVPHTLEVDDRSPAQVEAWLLVELLHRGIDRERFSKALPFSIQDLMSGDHEKFAILECSDELGAIAGWLSFAGSVLARLAPAAKVSVSAPDITLSVPVSRTQQSDGSGPYRIVTFSLGDAANPEPHFSAVRPTVGTVTPLRPETVLRASQLRGEELSAETIARRLDGGGARGAA